MAKDGGEQTIPSRDIMSEHSHLIMTHNPHVVPCLRGKERSLQNDVAFERCFHEFVRIFVLRMGQRLVSCPFRNSGDLGPRIEGCWPKLSAQSHVQHQKKSISRCNMYGSLRGKKGIFRREKKLLFLGSLLKPI